MGKPVFFGGKKLHRWAPTLVLALMGAIIFFALTGFAAAVSVVGPKSQSVVIDAGHGGYDPGATRSGGVFEKDLNLAVARYVREYLTRSGIRVVMTREEDTDYLLPGDLGGKTKKQTDLDGRIQLIEKSEAQICVSLHINSVPGSQMSGAETFYQAERADAKQLAETIQEELRKVNNMPQRVAKPGQFYLTQNVPIPTVIVELGYLSNPKESKLLQQPGYQQQLAAAIAQGIANYLTLHM